MILGKAGWAASGILAFASAAAVSAPVQLDLPRGTVGQQVIALGQKARISVVVPDASLWSQRVPALSGRWQIADALTRIAASSDAQLIQVGPGSWRLIKRPRKSAALAPPQPPSAIAAQQSGPDLVVTASKRDMPQYQFAAQVAHVTGSELELGGAGGTDRLATRLTSVASTYLGAGRNKLFIRGIADSSFTGPTQATVGQYYGDLRLSYNAPDPDLRLSDLAAVEVLEGPQGTLYGAGSLGGIIRLVPNAPNLTDSSLSAAAGGSLTEHGAASSDTQIVANIPVVNDRLAIRIVGNFATEGGYIDKPLLDRTDVNRTRIAGGRATAHLELGAGWNIELIAIGQRIRGADSQYADRDGPSLNSSAPVTEGFRADFRQAQVVIAGGLGSVRFRSTSGLTAHDLMERYDATLPDSPIRLFAQGNRTRTAANETRLWSSRSDGSGWLAGVSVIHNRTQLSRAYNDAGGVRPTTGVVNAITEGTLYAEGSYRLLPGVLATGGLRVTHSLLEGAGEDVGIRLTPALRAITARRSHTVVLPSASALIDLNTTAQLYLRYQQGFRPGGLAIEGDYVRRFRNDRVATIETGFRFGRSGRRASNGAVTVAHTSWRDIQADFIDGSGLPSTANIGDGKLWTIEGSLGVPLSQFLRLESGFSYNHSRIDDPSLLQAFGLLTSSIAFASVDRAAIASRLRQIPNIARVTARAGATYERQLDSATTLNVDAWIRYVGSSRLGVGPVLGQLQGDYLDTGLTARVLRGKVGVSTSVTNLADVRGNRFALGTPFPTGREQITPLRPRTIRVGVDLSF